MNEIEPRTTKSLQSKTWSAAPTKAKKNHWNYLPAKLRGQLPEISSTIKPKTFGSKIYKLGPYEGSLEELKEFAAFKGLTTLTNGAIRYKVA